MKQTRKLTNTRARMEDVAAWARVSTATVSRTLRNPSLVSEATRRRVQRAIRDIGYVQNLLAGSLAMSRTQVIAALVPTFSNREYAKTIHAMAEVLDGGGHHLLLMHHGFSLQEEESLVSGFLGWRVDGFFLYGRRHTATAARLLHAAAIPIVESGDLSGRPLDMVVGYSNFDAAKVMTEHLIRRGYRRIALVCGPWRESERHQARWRGYRAALKQHGLSYASRRVLETELTGKTGAQSLVALLDRDPHIDAIFFTSDVLAVGALLECSRRGWAVPDRVAIAGFDDQEIAGQMVPALTTVQIPREEIGRRVGEMLLNRLRGIKVNPTVVDVGFKLIDRESA